MARREEGAYPSVRARRATKPAGMDRPRGRASYSFGGPEVVAREVPLPATDMIVRSVSSDLSQLMPTQHLADHVLAFYERAPMNELEERYADLVIILESQLSVDEAKNFAWPSYVANAAKRFHCDAILLVLTDDPSVASWARGPFGPSRMPLRPVVFCLAEMPQQLPMDEALESPILAVLHALAHPGESTEQIALEKIQQFPDELRELSFAMIMNAQRVEYRGAVSAERLRKATLQVELVQEILEEGKAEARKQGLEAGRELGLEAGRELGLEAGRELGLEAGRELGLEEGRKKALEEARVERLAVIQGLAFDLLRSKQLLVTPDEEERLRKADETTLTALIKDLGVAVQEDQLRAAVARSLARVA
jgi:flagellar biosynthesis/type III secretory pathway protein FliH